MSYVGACPRARSDLTRPAVPAEVCEARIQGALSCANDVLNRQTFTFMSPRDTLKVPTYHTTQCAHARTRAGLMWAWIGGWSCMLLKSACDARWQCVPVVVGWWGWQCGVVVVVVVVG